LLSLRRHSGRAYFFWELLEDARLAAGRRQPPAAAEPDTHCKSLKRAAKRAPSEPSDSEANGEAGDTGAPQGAVPTSLSSCSRELYLVRLKKWFFDLSGEEPYLE